MWLATILASRRVGAGPDESLHRVRVRTVLSEEYFKYYSQKNCEEQKKCHRPFPACD